MTRRLAPITAVVLASQLVSASLCGDDVTLPAGEFSGPQALATATRFTADGQQPIVYIANADASELRAFLPAEGIFERGPNAISPLSIILDFRPTSLASGIAKGAAGSRGFVAVGGTTSRVAVVDAQTSRVVAASGDEAACAAGSTSASCLPGAVLDVAASSAHVFALVRREPPASPSAIAVLVPALERQGSADVPVLTFDRLIELDGEFGALAAAADDSRVWAANRTEPRVAEITVASGAKRDIAAALPVRDLVPTPEYVAGASTPRVANEFLLATLVDGRVQTLEPAAGAPARDPIATTEPIAPFDLGSPVFDLTFVPCPIANGKPCETALQVSSTETTKHRALAFAGLADGTTVALEPDPANPQVYRPLDRLAAAPSVDASRGITAEAGSVTAGVTRSETLNVTFRGVLPGFANRAGELLADGASFGLDDPEGAFDAPDAVRAGDLVAMRAPAGCDRLRAGVEATVATVAATRLTVTVTPALEPACAPARVAYTVRAAGDEPWTVTGPVTGFAGRAKSGERFVVEGERFYYPADAKAGPAVAFTITEPDTGAGLTQLTVQTFSGLSPFLIDVDGENGQLFSLAGGLAALPGRLFITLLGGDRLVDATLANLAGAGDPKIYQ